jgi:hypothetical protein
LHTGCRISDAARVVRALETILREGDGERRLGLVADEAKAAHDARVSEQTPTRLSRTRRQGNDDFDAGSRDLAPQFRRVLHYDGFGGG